MFEIVNGCQTRLQRLGAQLLYCGFIHAGRVVVADLLRDRVAVLGDGGLFQNAAQVLQIVFVQLAVNAPGGLIGRNRIHFLPAAAGVLVEVHARISRAVHGGGIEAGSVRKHSFRAALR